MQFVVVPHAETQRLFVGVDGRLARGACQQSSPPKSLEKCGTSFITTTSTLHMGKSRRRSKKGAVDEPMTVAQPSGGDGGGWLTGSAISEAMAEDTDGGGVKDAQNAAAPSQRALTAGLGKLKKRTVLRGVTKRKNKAIARGISHADRKEVKAKKKTAKRGMRLEGKQIY